MNPDVLPAPHTPDQGHGFMRFELSFCWACLVSVALAVVPSRTLAADGAAPFPVAVWPADPLELVMAFTEHVNPEWTKVLVGRSISYFDTVGRAAEGVSSVPALGALRIAGAKLVDQGRTLLLATDPHPRAARYELILEQSGKPRRVIVYDLSGVEVNWSAAKDDEGAEPAWKGWWPDLDVDATRRLTRGSARHERVLAMIEQPGRLTLSTLLALPPGETTVRIEASGAITEATLGDAQPISGNEPDRDGIYRVLITSQPRDVPQFFSFMVQTGKNGRPPVVRAASARSQSERFQTIERLRLIVPWATITSASSAPLDAPVPDLSGGVAKRGELLFFSDQGKCSQCHAIGGRGGTVGPDLTDIGRKGKEQIYRSIAAPSVEIAPDYVPYTVATRDGRVFAGVVQAEGADSIRITDTGAKATILRRDEIDQIRPSGTSIMPVGLAGGLGDSGLRDLIAFLTSRR